MLYHSLMISHILFEPIQSRRRVMSFKHSKYGLNLLKINQTIDSKFSDQTEEESMNL